jgi:hypothetical protein
MMMRYVIILIEYALFALQSLSLSLLFLSLSLLFLSLSLYLSLTHTPTHTLFLPSLSLSLFSLSFLSLSLSLSFSIYILFLSLLSLSLFLSLSLSLSRPYVLLSNIRMFITPPPSLGTGFYVLPSGSSLGKDGKPLIPYLGPRRRNVSVSKFQLYLRKKNLPGWITSSIVISPSRAVHSLK